jgi:uncharacterized protein YodC (DUF2158 family)
MTVSYYTAGDHVICQWFVGNDLKKAEFTVDSLEPVKD